MLTLHLYADIQTYSLGQFCILNVGDKSFGFIWDISFILGKSGLIIHFSIDLWRKATPDNKSLFTQCALKKIPGMSYARYYSSAWICFVLLNLMLFVHKLNVGAPVKIRQNMNKRKAESSDCPFIQVAWQQRECWGRLQSAIQVWFLTAYWAFLSL